MSVELEPSDEVEDELGLGVARGSKSEESAASAKLPRAGCTASLYEWFSVRHIWILLTGTCSCSAARIT